MRIPQSARFDSASPASGYAVIQQLPLFPGLRKATTNLGLSLTRGIEIEGAREAERNGGGWEKPGKERDEA